MTQLNLNNHKIIIIFNNNKIKIKIGIIINNNIKTFLLKVVKDLESLSTARKLKMNMIYLNILLMLRNENIFLFFY
jgi:hypothetical protein